MYSKIYFSQVYSILLHVHLGCVINKSFKECVVPLENGRAPYDIIFNIQIQQIIIETDEYLSFSDSTSKW